MRKLKLRKDMLGQQISTGPVMWVCKGSIEAKGNEMRDNPQFQLNRMRL